MARHHPDTSTLMAYAAGSLPEALSAVIAAHLSECTQCRADVEIMENVGGVLMGDLEEHAMSDRSAKASLLATAPAAEAGDTAVLEARPADSDDHENGDVPWPISKLVGTDIDRINWKWCGFGVWHHPIPLSDTASGDLRLIKVGPNRAMPDHGHGGTELTLVLRGAYSDHTGRYGQGDVADLDDTIEHQPVSDVDQGCICVIASERPAKFKGFIGRLIQPFTGGV